MLAGRKKRTVGVCTACRQDKVKCNSESTYPCTRCVLRNLDCTIDPRFRRTPVRQRLRSMRDELQQLRQAHRQPDQIFEASSTEPESVSRSERSVTQDQFTQPLPTGLISTPLPDTTFTLGSQTFAANDIRRRFNIFIQHFHPRLPVLDLEKSQDVLYSHSPLLFWTIFAITCRFEPLPDHSQQILYDELLGLLRSVALLMPLSLYSIQALILLCTWPLPTYTQLVDPTWLYYSLAIGGATYLKLNRPHEISQHGGARLTSTDVTSMSSTWLAIFCFSSTYSTWCDVDMSLSRPADLVVIQKFVDSLQLPTELSARAAISVIAAKHMNLATESVDAVTHEAMIDLAVAELDGIVREYSTVWSRQLEFLLQATKLSFLGSLLVKLTRMKHLSPAEESTRDGSRLSRLLLAGSVWGSHIITQFDSLVRSDPLGSAGESQTSWQKFAILPKVYYYIMAYTSFLLIRFCCSSTYCAPSTRESSCRAVEMARDALARSSRCPEATTGADEAIKISRNIDLLLRHLPDATANGLSIDDRGSGSILWDAMHKTSLIKGRMNQTDLLYLINPSRTYDKGDQEAMYDHVVNMDLDTFMQQFMDVGSLDAFSGAA